MYEKWVNFLLEKLMIQNNAHLSGLVRYIFPSFLLFLGLQEFSHDTSTPIDARLTTDHNDDDIFPYLLVNIGSGVSLIEVIFHAMHCFIFVYTSYV